MTPQKLSEIEARAKAATEGPWEVTRGKGWPFWIRSVERLIGIADLHFIVGDSERTAKQIVKNSEFIAYARQDIPDLIAEVRRLQSEIEELQIYFSDVMHTMADQRG